MKKNILFVGDAQSVHLKKWIDYFVRKNYEVFLATFSQNNITECNNVFYLSTKPASISGNNYYYLLAVPKIVGIIRKIKPDYINAHYSYSMGLIALLALKLSGLPADLSIVCHGSDILDVPNKLYVLSNKFVLTKADKIVAVSNQITDRLLELGIDGEKIFTGQYGISENILENYQCKDIDIIANRNYVPNSRIDQLLEALNKPYFYKKKIVFILPHITQERMDVLRQRYTFISFFKAMPHLEMLELVARSKIYLSATKSDGSSLSLLEALASGAFPVVSNIASNREWIVDGLNGLLFNNFREMEGQLVDIMNKDISFYNDAQQYNKRIIVQRALYEKQMGKIGSFLFC